jgi:hypothetical protein
MCRGNDRAGCWFWMTARLRVALPSFASPRTSKWANMKTPIYLIGPALLVLLPAIEASAQTQAPTGAATPSAGRATTSTGQKQGATAQRQSGTTSRSGAATSNRRSTVSGQKSKIPPPPPPLALRRHRRTAKTATMAKSSELDQYGRTDTAGHGVGFYPQTRGVATGGTRTSAYRQGKRLGKVNKANPPPGQ